MIKDILRLKYSATLSHEAIARSLGISKGVVAKYLALAGAAGLDWVADDNYLGRRIDSSELLPELTCCLT